MAADAYWSGSHDHQLKQGGSDAYCQHCYKAVHVYVSSWAYRRIGVPGTRRVENLAIV